jgi:hypothetical protein
MKHAKVRDVLLLGDCRLLACNLGCYHDASIRNKPESSEELAPSIVLFANVDPRIQLPMMLTHLDLTESVALEGYQSRLAPSTSQKVHFTIFCVAIDWT